MRDEVPGSTSSGPAGAVLGCLRRRGLPVGVVQVQRLKPRHTPRDLTGALHLLRLRGQQPGLPPPPRRSPPAPGQLLMVELRGTTTLGSPFHRRLHYDSFSPDYLPQPIAMVNQGQHDADMPTAMAFYTWAATSRSIVRRSLAAPSSFFFGCFDRHAHTPTAVGPDGLPIMIGASARQEPGIRGHPPGSWRKPRVPSHCYDDAAQFREAVFSGASPVRVR